MPRAHVIIAALVLLLLSSFPAHVPRPGMFEEKAVPVQSTSVPTPPSSVPAPDVPATASPNSEPASSAELAAPPVAFDTSATAPASQPPAAVVAPAVATSVTAEPIVWQQKTPGYPLTSDDPAAAGRKVAMLTFDDGPGPGTAAILDVLAAHHVKALFFITGSAFKHLDLVQREYNEGHVLGVHTMSHANLTKLTPAQMRPEIEPLLDLIKQVTGVRPKYMRPPYGSWNKDVAAVADGYHLQIINWTDGSLDWDDLDANGWKDPHRVADSVMKQLGRGSIILMHDTKKHTGEALPEIIQRVEGAGYEFVVLP